MQPLLPVSLRPWRPLLRRLVTFALALTLVLPLLLGAQLPARPVEASGTIRWGYYVTYDPASKTSVEENISKLDYVSPWFYTLTEDGTVTGKGDPALSALARSHNVKLLPMIKNEGRYDAFHKLLANPEKVSSAIDQLLTLVNNKGYDGIHIDFEAVNGTDRDLLTRFMDKLNARFKPAGKLVTMAVAAKTYDAKTGWAGAYDYAALSRHLDYAVIMAYDFKSVGSTVPGPVAPISWVRDVAKFSAAEMGQSKVILGVPFYGYDWNKAKGPPAESRRHKDTMDLSQQYKGTVRYDAEMHELCLTYVKDGEEHEVWFENAESFEQKLKVVEEIGLAGFAGWRLGHEDPAVWSVIGDKVNPTAPIPPFEVTSERLYFPETGHSLGHGFLYYWRNNGGLAMFGYPRTEEFTEGGYTVQYFERARFEYHPEFKGTPYEVLLGLLGSQAVDGRRFDNCLPFDDTADRRYFAATGHSLSYGFKYYWDNNGGLPMFGYPISEEFSEVNPEDGRTYTVQYFERARFEYHPEFKGTPYEVELGLLGNQAIRKKGWID